MERIHIIKLKVLNHSLTLEKIASMALGAVLDIKDIKSSKSLGNTSEALSLNQKVNLLIDFGIIEKGEKKILETAMKIRNQFMHNIDCETYQDAFNHCDGEENKLKKIYPELFKNEDPEINLEKVTDRVFEDCFKIVGTIRGNLDKKFTAMSESEVNRKLVASYEQNIPAKFGEFFDEFATDRFDISNREELLARIKTLFHDVLVGSVKKVNDKFNNQ